MLKEFLEFGVLGNVMDLAAGVVIGAALQSSLDILTAISGVCA